MPSSYQVVVRSVGYRWTRSPDLLWLDLGLEDGRDFSVGVPVAYFAGLVIEGLQRRGVMLPCEVGDDLASVDGFGHWLKKASKKAGKLAKKAVKDAAHRTLKLAKRSVMVAATPWALKRNLRLIKAEARDMKKDLKAGAPVLKLASTGASFIPGIGTAAAAGLGAAAAIGEGKSLANIAKEAALSAMPGGMLTRMAVETAIGAASGKRLDRALVQGVRKSVPGGPVGQAVFDGALHVAQGQRLDRVAAQGALQLAEAYGGKLGRTALSTGLQLAQGKRAGKVLGAAAGELAGAYGGPAAKAAMAGAVAIAQGKRVDRAVLGAATTIAGAVVKGAKADQLFGAISGPGLAAMGGANRLATFRDEAVNAAGRIRTGLGSKADHLLVAKAKGMSKGVVKLAGSGHPAARLALCALAEQAAPVTRATVRALPPRRAQPRAVISGPLGGFDALQHALAARRRQTRAGLRPAVGWR
jgi:hypothetical protein